MKPRQPGLFEAEMSTAWYATWFWSDLNLTGLPTVGLNNLMNIVFDRMPAVIPFVYYSKSVCLPSISVVLLLLEHVKLKVNIVFGRMPAGL